MANFRIVYLRSENLAKNIRPGTEELGRLALFDRMQERE